MSKKTLSKICIAVLLLAFGYFLGLLSGIGLRNKHEAESRRLEKEGEPPQSSDQPDELEKMTVVQLRKMAMSIEGLSIKGRQIQRANKAKLLSEIRKALQGTAG